MLFTISYSQSMKSSIFSNAQESLRNIRESGSRSGSFIGRVTYHGSGGHSLKTEG